MRIKKILLSLLLHLVIAGCATNSSSSYLGLGVDAAKKYAEKQQWAKAYIALEASLGESPNRDKAIEIFNSIDGFRSGARETFSFEYLTSQINQRTIGTAYAFESQRLKVYKTVASDQDYLTAQKNFERAFGEYERTMVERERFSKEIKEKEEVDAAQRRANEEAEKERLARDRLELKSRYEASRAIAKFECSNELACTKAFSLAEIFVAENSDLKIQVVSRSIIETYNPTEEGKFGGRIVKMPHKGTSNIIFYTPVCKSDSNYCLIGMTKRNIEFSIWMNSNFRN